MTELKQWVETERNRLAEQRNALLREFYLRLGELNGRIGALDAVLALDGVATPPTPDVPFEEVPASTDGSPS